MDSVGEEAGVRVLVVTADRDFASAAEQRLPAEANLSVSAVGTVSGAVDHLEKGPAIDCVVSDHDLPETDGIALLEMVRAQRPSLPFILFTSEGDERMASRAISAGVTDYLIKERYADQWDRLATLVADAVSYYRTQRELVDPVSRAKTLLDNTHDTLLVARDGVCEYVNQTGVQLLKADDRSAVIGRSVDDFSREDGIAFGGWLDAIQAGEGGVRKRRYRLTRADGTDVPVTVTTSRIEWAGEPAVLLVVRDVSDRKEMKREVELRNRAINEAPIGMTIADASEPDNPLIYVNEKFLELTGYAESEVLGRNCRFLQGEETDPEPVAKMREAIEEREPVTVELRNYRKDGTEFWNRVSVAPVTDTEGEVTHYVGFQEDVTERKEAERGLRRFERAVEAAGHAIYVTDAAGTITYVNPAFERITGYDADEALGENPRILNSGEHPESHFAELWKTVTEGGIWEEDVVNRRKNGELYYAEQTIAPITDADGDITGCVAIQTDVTERKRTETVLRQYRQATESSKDLLAAVDENHEYLFANREYRRYHGLETVDVTDYSLDDVLEDGELNRVEPEIRKAFAGNQVQLELTRTHPEKGERILDARIFPLKGTDGEIHGVGASMRDVTESRERKAEIKREAELRRLMSEINQTLVRAEDLESLGPEIVELIGSTEKFACTFLYVTNHRQAELICQNESNLTESRIEKLHTRKYLDAVFEEGVLVMDDVTESPFAQHDSHVSSHAGVAVAIADGDRRYGVLTVHFTPGEPPTSDEIELLGTIADDLSFFVSKRRIETEHKLFADIVERIHDPVMLQGRDGKFRVVNEATAEFAGMEPDELEGTDETAFMDVDAAETIRRMKQTVLEVEEPASYQVNPTFPDGRERTFSTTRHPYYDDQGRLDGTIAICRDVTDLNEHQRHLQILDRVLRHNVNNNMNAVQGYAQLIREEASGEVREYAERIASNSERLLDIAEKQRKITEFLSKPRKKEVLDLANVVERLRDRIQWKYPGAEFSTSCPDEVSVVASMTIERAIEELVTNGIVHADGDETAVSLEVTPAGGTVAIEVVDENEAVPEMDRAVLLGDVELSALDHGSGLGMWLIKLVVDHSDGTLSFEKNEPRGNVVRIQLPAP